MDANDIYSTNRRRPTIRRGRLHPPEPLSTEHAGSTGVMVMYFCIFSCITVYTAWQWSIGNLRPEADELWGNKPSRQQRQTLEMLRTHFTLKLDDVRQERWWTLITPAFSHVDADHLCGNLIAFSTFSRMLLSDATGPISYSVLVLGSAVSSHLAFLYQAAQRQPTIRWWDFFTPRKELHALGLSGVVMGLGAAVSLTAPTAKVLVLRSVSMPIWLVMALYVVYNSARLNDETSTVGHAAHLGGVAFGVIFHLLVLLEAAVPLWIGRLRNRRTVLQSR